MDAAQIASRLWTHLAPVASPDGAFVTRPRPVLTLDGTSFVPHLAIWRAPPEEGVVLESVVPDVVVVVQLDEDSIREAITAQDTGRKVPDMTWWVIGECVIEVLTSAPGGRLLFAERTISLNAVDLPPFGANVDLRPFWNEVVPPPGPIPNQQLSLLGLLSQCFDKNECLRGYAKRSAGFESNKVAAERFASYVHDAERLFGAPRGCVEAPGVQRAWWDRLRLQRCGRMVHAWVAEEGVFAWWHREDVWMAPRLAWEDPLPQATASRLSL